MVPVAKRNFRVRHHHFEEDPRPTAGSDEYERRHEVQGAVAESAAASPSNLQQLSDRNKQKVEPAPRGGDSVASSVSIEYLLPPSRHAPTIVPPKSIPDNVGTFPSFARPQADPVKSVVPSRSNILFPGRAKEIPPQRNFSVRNNECKDCIYVKTVLCF